MSTNWKNVAGGCLYSSSSCGAPSLATTATASVVCATISEDFQWQTYVCPSKIDKSAAGDEGFVRQTGFPTTENEHVFGYRRKAPKPEVFGKPTKFFDLEQSQVLERAAGKEEKKMRDESQENSIQIP